MQNSPRGVPDFGGVQSPAVLFASLLPQFPRPKAGDFFLRNEMSRLIKYDQDKLEVIRTRYATERTEVLVKELKLCAKTIRRLASQLGISKKFKPAKVEQTKYMLGNIEGRRIATGVVFRKEGVVIHHSFMKLS